MKGWGPGNNKGLKGGTTPLERKGPKNKTSVSGKEQVYPAW